VVPIPQSFADLYTSGRRLGVGVWRFISRGINVGEVSCGPSLTAIDPPDISQNPHLSALANTPLVGYPYQPGGTQLIHTNACTRLTSITSTDYQGWNPRSDTGYWFWNDQWSQSAVWIDLSDKQGLLISVPLEMAGDV